MSDVKTIPLRLEHDLYMAIAQYALDNGMSRTAVIRGCIAAKFTVGQPAATDGGSDNGQSESEGKGKTTRKRKGK